ncbi:MAG: sugar phosphate isomerase/epimerase [Clostridia bacterium]|nr:sugar phosphate isomerase/epimerase [Clostridia bacterium]
MLKISLINPKLNPVNADREKYYRLYREARIDGLDYSIYKFTEQNGYEPRFFEMSAEEIIEKYLAKEKEELDRYGLEVCQTHAPSPTYRHGDEEGNKYRLLEAKRSIELSRYLGSPYLIVHPVQETMSYPLSEIQKRNIDYYSQLIDTAKQNGVTVCLENMWNIRNGNIFECTCEDPNETNYYIDTLNKMAGEEIFGFCFDVGHASLVARNIKNTILTLGKRIKTLHIHDTDKTSDLHTLPYTQLGSGKKSFVDYLSMTSALRTVGYRGPINFEAHAAFEVFPEPTHGALLGMFRAIGEHFSNEITGE